MPAQDFYLSAFDANLQMDVCGNLSGGLTSAFDASSVAVYQISLDAAKLAFRFQTDASDITNVAADDVKYYVYKNNFPDISSAIAGSTVVDASAIASGYDANKMLLKHDYVRYLALRLFNTHHGVDLFNNETELLADICANAVDVSNHIQTILNAVDVSGAGTGLSGGANNYYFTGADSSANNLSKLILNHIISADPSRLSSVAGSELQSMPFIADDTLNFKVTVKAHADQHNLTGVAAIPDRSYRIKLVLKASPSNTTPVD